MSKRAFCAFLFCLFLIILPGNVYSMDMKNIIAFPVPFNPKIHNNIEIGNKPATSVGPIDKVKIEIYDINGDSVFKRDYSSLNVYWNGRNNSGKIVRPGLYIIKVTLENSATGAYGKKIIRILVQG